MLRDRRDPATRLDPGGSTVPVPRSLESLVAARLDALPPELKALVHDAAVLGKVFWPGAVAAVAELDRLEVEAKLPFLVRRELVTKLDESSIADEPELAFRHDVIREVAYGQIPKAARARKHRNAAAWIRAVGEEREADFAGILPTRQVGPLAVRHGFALKAGGRASPWRTQAVALPRTGDAHI